MGLRRISGLALVCAPERATARSGAARLARGCVHTGYGCVHGHSVRLRAGLASIQSGFERRAQNRNAWFGRPKSPTQRPGCFAGLGHVDSVGRRRPADAQLLRNCARRPGLQSPASDDHAYRTRRIQIPGSQRSADRTGPRHSSQPVGTAGCEFGSGCDRSSFDCQPLLHHALRRTAAGDAQPGAHRTLLRGLTGVLRDHGNATGPRPRLHVPGHGILAGRAWS